MRSVHMRSAMYKARGRKGNDDNGMTKVFIPFIPSMVLHCTSAAALRDTTAYLDYHYYNKQISFFIMIFYTLKMPAIKQ